MRESIANRVKRIVSGSANALVDAIEDMAPEAVMEQAIREIDGALDDVRAELGTIVANKHLASKRLMEENSKHEELAKNIELAVHQNRDDLAEAAISRQLDIEAQIPILEQSINDGTSQEKELEGYITALQARKREMQKDLQDFRSSRQHAEAVRATGDTAQGFSVAQAESAVAKAESAFDRLMSKHTGLPGSTSTGDSKTAAQLAELEGLSRSNRVKERLAAVKAHKL